LSDQPDAEISDNTQHSQGTDINRVGLEPAIPASEWLRSNGIARFSGTTCKKKLGHSFKYFQTVKESKLFIKFPFIWFNHLKLLNAKNNF
jgi:hypothetical protein